ncbi:MAG: hypothetical protein L0216_04955 [Planctomycetales bacterium]|nr:hypothetical protein [Planctomycetales bacterium]
MGARWMALVGGIACAVLPAVAGPARAQEDPPEPEARDLRGFERGGAPGRNLRLPFDLGRAGFGAVAGILAAPLEDEPRITLDVKEKPLVEAIAFLKEKSGRNILLGKDAQRTPLADVWPPILVTVKLEDVHWEDALRIVADAAGCVSEKSGAVWTVSRPAVVDLDFEKADLRDVVQAIAAAVGANVVVGSDVPRPLPVSVRLRRTPWRKALDSVVKAVEMTLVKEPDADIWVIRNPEGLKKHLETRVIRLRSAGPTRTDRQDVRERLWDKDVKFPLARAVEACLTRDKSGKPLGGVDYDVVTNSLIVSDVPDRLDLIERIIEAFEAAARLPDEPAERGALEQQLREAQRARFLEAAAGRLKEAEELLRKAEEARGN